MDVSAPLPNLPGPAEPAEAPAPPPTSEAPGADTVLLQRERDALRVIVAAVAAQQAALSDEEARLRQREDALALQELQLAGHLDERQAELDEQAERLHRERDEFEVERAAGREALAADAEQRAALQRQLQRVARRRQQVKALRLRLEERYRRHTREKDAELARLAAGYTARERQLEHERDRLRVLQQRANGELELGRRALREEAEQLALDQQRWHEAAEADRRDEARRRAEFDAEQRRWREEHARLKRECEGLDARARHLRRGLPTPEREVIQVVAPPPIAPALLPELSPEWPQRLRELAGVLADQRNHLAEQWRGLLQTQQQWQEERLAALAALERTGEQLGQRERDVAAAERRARALDARRAELDARQARLVVEQAEWQARRDELQSGLDACERLVQRQGEELEKEQAEHKRQSEVELTELRAARGRCEEARRQAAVLWGECDRLRNDLAEQRRRLAAESIAQERLRSELAHQSPDAGRAEARLEKIGRRELTRLESDARAVEAERGELRRWREELDAESDRLGRLEDELLARRDELSRQAEAWRKRRADAEAEGARHEAELWRLRARQALDERQLRQLRDEVERLACSLIEDGPAPEREAA